VKYAYIETHIGSIYAARACRALGVARSGYYDWKARGESKRSKQDSELLARIKEVHLASREAYGAIKTWRELNMRGIACGKHRVARLRRQAGIEARRKRRFRVIVENHHTAPAAPNLVQRQFDVAIPNQVWVGDGTFIRTRQGFLHLAVLLDLHSRRVVGWGMGDRPNLLPVMSALDMALLHRQPERRSDSPHRPGNALCSTGLPREVADARPATEHEPARQLLRQCGSRELLLKLEERTRASLRLPYQR